MKTETFKIILRDENDTKNFQKTAKYNIITGKFSNKFETILKQNNHSINTTKKIVIIN